jgi:membrane associated rhomboid family serine protease
MMKNGLLDEFKNAFRKPENGLVQLILINVIVFVTLIILNVVLTLSGAGNIYHLILRQLMLPADFEVFLSRPWTLITYFFTHEGFFHILFNMLFLYWFGRLISEYLGNKRLISLYVLGGLAGGVTYMLIYNLLPYFHEQIPIALMLGASAGVYAVVVGAATLMPDFTFFLLFLGPVRIKYIALFYVFLSFAQTVGTNAGGNLAHLGGALIGFIFIRQLQKGNDIGKPVNKTLYFFQNLFKPRPKIRVSYKKQDKNSSNNALGGKPNKPKQDEIDAILDKISAKGYESLSKEEKQKLFNASKK